MADRTPLKIDDRNAISDDDPFAELTRIMGFDPRQPARPQPADPVMGDDFDIDLEKELMGEFGLEDEASAIEAPAVEAESAQPFAASGQGPAYDPRDAEDVSDHLSGLDDAIAASMQDFEFEADEPEHASAPQVEFERDFDDALNFDDALAQSFELEEEPAQAAAVPEAAALEYGAEPAAEPDFDSHFDEAMANVDMDFDPREEAEIAASPEPSIPQFSSPELFADDGAAYEDDAIEDEIREFRPETEQQAEPQPVAAADLVAAPLVDVFSYRPEVAGEPAAPVEPVAVAQERSLEDELNALLGNMSARIGQPLSKAEDAPQAGPSVDAPVAAKAFDPYVVAGMSYGAQAPVSQPHASQPSALQPVPASDPEADLEALLTNELVSPAIETAAYPQPAPEAEAEDVDFDFNASDFEALTVEDEPQPAEPVAPAPQPILSRFWNRMSQVPEAAPARAEAPAPTSSYRQEAAPAPAPASVFQPETVVRSSVTRPAAPVYEDAPDVETVDVPERVVALPEDLEIPELAFEEDRPVSPSFDDLDHDFTGLITDLNGPDAVSAPSPAAKYDDEPYGSGFANGPAASYGSARAYAEQPDAIVSGAASKSYDEDGFDAPRRDDRPFAPADVFDHDDFDFDPELDEAMTVPGLAAAESASRPRRRGLLIAAVVGAVAVVGGIGAFALSPGGGSGGAPVIVKADDSPIKVKPENPGGTVVPNQDNKVYEAVAKGIQPAAPTQEKLVADNAEPVNVNAAEPQARVADPSPDEADDVADGSAPIGKSEDRIEQSAADAGDANQDVALVTPRKVRTMVVKPDGTLAPREDLAPAEPEVAAAEPADPAPQRVVSAPAASQDLTGAVSSAEGEPAAKPAARSNAQSATTPATVAAAPQRPSDQPVDVVGEVKPDEVASISPTAAAAGSWSMQIASQPSADAAQSTYKDLARRYGSVLEGHSVNIVKAEIAGKGTFYRVRVPANSRNEAISLCESYKAAGGNCFVSK